MKELLSASTWNIMWQDFRAANTASPGRKMDQGEFWNQRAESFANNTVKSRDSSRVDTVFDFLRYHRALQPGISVLDIGSGPGSFAIPFARLGCRVTALDPSRRMLDLFKESIPNDLRDSIETLEGLWEDIDPDAQGWVNQFDLIFASMCPGVNEQALIEKMMLCSRQWCYVSAFSGPRNFEVYDEVWGAITGHPYPNHFNDIIFPFNLVYAQGYKPMIQFIESSFTQKEHPDKFTAELYSLLPQTPTRAQEEAIRSIILRHTKDDAVHQLVRSSVGMMLWRVKE